MPNSLIHESSPYLLQHAHNPVDWMAYGPDAFALAVSRDQPIFLSSGYSTCHWCHVMAHESFENLEAARLLNESFVCVKLDREERPDVDRLYMHVCQLLTRHGGWPLNLLLLPDGRPFFAATYIPLKSGFGRTGLIDFVKQVNAMWLADRPRIESTAQAITTELEAISSQAGAGNPPSPEVFRQAKTSLAERFDKVYAGFLPAPKFPLTQDLDLLLRSWRNGLGQDCLEMSERTLLAIVRGGMSDQVGYGVHRYSTDAAYGLPHFEKMLYDQALVLLALADCYRAGGNVELLEAGKGIAEFCLRELTTPRGDFYSALDADSEGREGKFYVWSHAEIESVLGPQDAALYAKVFEIRQEGNFREEATGELTGENVPRRGREIGELARETGFDPLKLSPHLETLRKKLFAARAKRVRPGTDTKILTDLNGLMIAALARCGRAFGDSGLILAAKKAAEALIGRQTDPRGRLWRCQGQGGGQVRAMLSDYAALGFGLCELYQATFDPGWLAKARALALRMLELFSDPAGGGLFMAEPALFGLSILQKEAQDGAIPPGNALAARLLCDLSRLLDDKDFDAEAMRILRAFGLDLAQVPQAFASLLCVADSLLEPPQVAVILGPPTSQSGSQMLSALAGLYRPNLLTHCLNAENLAELVELVPYLKELPEPEAEATAYVRRGRKWLGPAKSPEEMLMLLKG